MNEQIKNHRHDRLKNLLKDNKLKNILFLNPGLGNIDIWLQAEEKLPTPAPFNRNSAYIFSCDGMITRLCQTTTHPTDRDQFPHFEDTDLSFVFDGSPVGIVNPAFLKKNVRDHLANAYPQFDFIDLTDAFYQIKAVRSAEEIEALRKAAYEYDLLFTSMPLVIRPERLEKEVVNEIRQRMMWQGSESETPGFHTMVRLTSSNDGCASAAEPLPWPGRRIMDKDRINVSINGYINNGCAAALGRSFVIGEASPLTKEYWTIASEAQSKAAQLARPGATLREIDKAVNDFLKRKGLGSTGTAWIHGIGTSAYEAPRNVDSSADWPLCEGMVLVIAPEIKPDGQDAFSCMDTFVVTKDGAVRLGHTPIELREL
ncbi:MAG: aminopeptidase P family protein [Lachnospiraceae bacterium]|nr:aminopeptidase P family protein [Lachnospiraceae bacterium]